MTYINNFYNNSINHSTNPSTYHFIKNTNPYTYHFIKNTTINYIKILIIIILRILLIK